MEDERIQPRRRRWAAGYIERSSCPSYAYTSTRRSPDLDCRSGTEYTIHPRGGGDDYIEADEQRDQYTFRHTTKRSEVRDVRSYSTPSDFDLGGPCRHVEDSELCYGFDLEDVADHRHVRTQAPTASSYDFDTGEGSDIVLVNRRDGDSDIASIHNMHRSRSRSDQRSIGSFSMHSDVQDKRGRISNSNSDDEGGYISLDDYITGRSDCVSNHSLSEDEGEGSDAVGSDVEEEKYAHEGSDAAHGSDVASLSGDDSFDDEEDSINDEEDCIDGGSQYYAHGR